MHTKDEKLKAIGELLDIMDELREKCPWDKKQTLESLRYLTIEETYELADAILENDLEEIKKELGDLLLHIVFYAKIGSEKGSFDIADVARAINEKLVYRHPHVFGDVVVRDDEEVKENWEHLKMKEGNHSVLGGVPKSLPSLVKANRIQEKVKGVGFDWTRKEEIWKKVEEEINELKEAISNGSPDEMEVEMGDLFFTIINASRLYGINPENALEKTNQKFIRRFKYLEERSAKLGLTLKELSLEEMDRLWTEAKETI